MQFWIVVHIIAYITFLKVKLQNFTMATISAMPQFKRPNVQIKSKYFFSFFLLASTPEVPNSGIQSAFQASSLCWSSQEVAAIGPGIGPQGEVPAVLAGIAAV